jgi:hypothetical protein
MKSKVEANKIERLTAKSSRKAPASTPPPKAPKSEAPKSEIPPAKKPAQAKEVSRCTVGLADYTIEQLSAGKTPEEINHMATEKWPCIKETPGWLKYFIHAKDRLNAQAAKAAAKLVKSKPEGEKTTKAPKSKKG